MPLTTENKAQINESATKWRNIATHRLTEVLLRSPAAVSPQIDKLSSWLLGGTAATVVLLITNAERVLEVLYGTDLRTALLILTISGAFGTLAKVQAVYAAMRLGIHERIIEEGLRAMEEIESHSEPLRKIADEHGYPYDTAPDVDAAVDEFIAAIPGWWRWFLKRKRATLKANPQLEYRKITRGVFYQGVWTTLQVLTYVTFVLWIAFTIG